MNQDQSKASDSEHLLRFERNFISGILETTSALIVVLDAQGRVLRLNRAIEMLMGFTILEAVGACACPRRGPRIARNIYTFIQRNLCNSRLVLIWETQ